MGCTVRYTHDTLRINYISELSTAYQRDQGVTHDWNGSLRAGNPIRNDLATQYMTFEREEQEKAGAEVSQAPARLHSHLAAITAP